ncbi:MAG: DPP IV N-terminal domain-containing protein, partial [Bacteroidales bacterium]|nr:DPP IV N-terminal domain-containing protein [Bacteroidales bacterium]
MKRMMFFLLALLLTGPFSLAQEERRVMTMEEAVLGRGLMIQSPSWHWTGDKTVVALDEPGARPMRERPAPLAFTKGNNLYYRDVSGNEHAITAYHDPGIVCGQSVSRNEFGISGGIFVSPDSSKIAFYRKDERAVTLFPLLDITTRTGTLREIRYPMNGMTSEKIALGVYDIASGTTVWMDVTDFDEERYLTNITWGPASDRIYIQVLDRPQKHVHLNVYDVSDGRCLGTLLTEENNRWVEPQEPLVFLESDPDQFLYFTDNRHGYKNYYLCSASGKFEPRRLTDVDADCSFVAQRGRYLFFYSAEVSPVENHLIRIDLKTGKKVRLTRAEGWHSCQISPDGKYFMDSWSSLDVPRVMGWG